MKNILTILAAGILALVFSSQISASGYSGKTESGGESGSMAKAIKHAEMAASRIRMYAFLLKLAEFN
jgi:hypothetical protein